MSRILQRPIRVWFKDGLLRKLDLGRRVLEVERVSDYWREGGRWWEGEREKDFYLVEAGEGSYLLYFDRGTNRWFLYKELD